MMMMIHVINNNTQSSITHSLKCQKKLSPFLFLYQWRSAVITRFLPHFLNYLHGIIDEECGKNLALTFEDIPNSSFFHRLNSS